MGLFGGLLGIGGSIIMIPAMVLAFGAGDGGGISTFIRPRR